MSPPPDEYRCYYMVGGKPCGSKLVDGVLTGESWVKVRCPKCKRLIVFPRSAQ